MEDPMKKSRITALIFLLVLLAATVSAASFEKAAYEQFFRYVDFSNILQTGETISIASVTVTDVSTGADTSSSMVSGVAPYDDTMVIYMIKGGTAGHRYTVTIHVVTSLGQQFSNNYHEQLECIVRR
jgi:hypothetical protein